MKKLFQTFLALFLSGLLILPLPALAARVNTIGVELNSMTAAAEFSLNGLFSAAADGATTTKTHTGVYSLKFNEQGTAEFSWMAYKFLSAASAATTTARAYIYLNQTFGATQELMSFANESPGQLASLQLNASNQLCLTNVTPAQVGSCTTITTGAWHYIELSTNGSTNVFGSLDGTVFASGFTGTETGAISRVYFGCAFAASCKSDTYYDDMAINDGTGANQTWWPGSGNEVLLRPMGTGDANTWHLSTIEFPIGTVNNFTFLNQIPIATGQTGTWLIGSTTAASDFYTAASSSTVPDGATVNVVQILSRHAFGAATPGAFKVQLKKTTGGTVSQGTAVTPVAATSTNAAAAPYNPQLTLYADPNGAAWVASTTATMQIGAADTTAGAGAIHLSGIYAYVDYSTSTITRLFLTSTTSWFVPTDFNAANNSIEAIGGGGGGMSGGSQEPGGGGGGAYVKSTNVALTACTAQSVQIGQGASGGALGNNNLPGTATDSWLGGTSCFGSTICARAGSSTAAVSSTGATGGTTANSVGQLKFAGGNGGTVSNSDWPGGGGGGAGGPFGVGANGGAVTSSAGTTGGAPGGGGNGGGKAGTTQSTAASNNGLAGGNNSSNVGGGPQVALGVAGSTGTFGGGGGGGGGNTTGAAGLGGTGGIGNEWDPLHGSGGGGGGGGGVTAGTGDTAKAGGNGGLYGAAGGGGGTASTPFAGAAGGAGAQGIIVITYVSTGIQTCPGGPTSIPIAQTILKMVGNIFKMISGTVIIHGR